MLRVNWLKGETMVLTEGTIASFQESLLSSGPDTCACASPMLVCHGVVLEQHEALC